jgi:hypothetical protein
MTSTFADYIRLKPFGIVTMLGKLKCFSLLAFECVQSELLVKVNFHKEGRDHKDYCWKGCRSPSPCSCRQLSFISRWTKELARWWRCQGMPYLMLNA